MEKKYIERVCDPNIFQNVTHFEVPFGTQNITFVVNDLDAYLFSRQRLTDVQLAALSSQLSHQSSVFDSMTDEQRVQFLSSRYNQNFASVDSYRQYLVEHMNELESVAAAEMQNAVVEPPVEPSSAE